MKRILAVIALTSLLTLYPSVLMASNPTADPAPDPPVDTDSDGIPDADDNCPEVANQAQTPSPENAEIGLACDEETQTTILEDLSDISEEYSNTDANETEYNNILAGFETCSRRDAANHPVCHPPEDLDTVEDDDFRDLYKALLNNSIVTILEEPIGNEHIFKRAKVCKTEFLKDENGLLQPVGIGEKFSVDWNTWNSSTTASPQEFYASQYRAYLEDVDNSSYNFAITLGDCEEFLVQECEIRTEGNNMYASLAEPLPIKVYCDRVQLLFANSGAGIIQAYVGLIYRWAAGIIGVVAVVVIMINGILISASGGDQSKMESARGRILQSLTALALLFLSGILLYSINPNFFTNRTVQEVGQQEQTTPAPEEPESTN